MTKSAIGEPATISSQSSLSLGDRGAFLPSHPFADRAFRSGDLLRGALRALGIGLRFADHALRCLAHAPRFSPLRGHLRQQHARVVLHRSHRHAYLRCWRPRLAHLRLLSPGRPNRGTHPHRQALSLDGGRLCRSPLHHPPRGGRPSLCSRTRRNSCGLARAWIRHDVSGSPPWQTLAHGHSWHHVRSCGFHQTDLPSAALRAANPDDAGTDPQKSLAMALHRLGASRIYQRICRGYRISLALSRHQAVPLHPAHRHSHLRFDVSRNHPASSVRHLPTRYAASPRIDCCCGTFHGGAAYPLDLGKVGHRPGSSVRPVLLLLSRQSLPHAPLYLPHPLLPLGGV